jgi:two-component system NtrC family sensor kinase
MKDGSVATKEKHHSRTRCTNNGNKVDSQRTFFESDDVFHLIAENSTDMIIHFHLSPTHQLSYVSPSSERITGYTPEEYYDSPEIIINSIHPEDKNLFEDFIYLINPDENGPLTLRLIHKDGKTIWTEQKRTVTRNENGEPLNVFLYCREITERKLAAEALRESQKFVSSLLENAPHAVVVINPDTSIRYVNPAWEELNGWTLSEIVGTKAPYPWWPDDQKDALLEGFREAMKQAKGQGELPAKKKNGDIYWIDINWTSVKHDGELQYLLINSIDITERRKLEQLQNDENRVLTLLGQGAELQELLDAIVLLGEASDPSIKGSIFTYDSLTGRLIFRSAPSLPKDFKKLIKDGLPVHLNEGTSGTAAYLKQRVIVPDINSSPIYPFKKDENVVIKNGLFACWSQPIISSSGELLGVITNYGNKIGEPSEDNLSVLDWSVRIAVIAIEHKKAEEALANEATRRRILVEQSSDGIVVLDQNGKVYEVNRRFAEMLGYTLEEALQLYVWDWDTQCTKKQLLEKVRSVGEEGEHLETYWQRKDGSVVDVEISTNGVNFAGQKFVFCVCRDTTERKRAEEALKESEEKYRSVVENTNSGIIVIQDNQIVFHNSWIYQTLGYKEEEYSKLNFTEMIHPEDVALTMERIQERSSGAPGNDTIEIRVITKSGDIKWIEASSVLINWNNKPAIQAFILDITERRQAEEALRESEEKFSKAFHASPGSISISRLSDGKFIEVNESFLRDKGFSREEVIGHNMIELGIAEVSDEHDALYNTLRESGEIQNRLYNYRTKSGELRTAYMSAEPINLGNEPCILAQSFDVTEQKRATDKLRLLSSITQQVSDATIVTDLDFKITYINQAAQDLLGYFMDEVCGEGSDIFNTHSLTETQRQKILKVLDSGKVWSGTVTKTKKDGTNIICESKLSPLLDENGNTVSYIDILHDVTRQKETESKLNIQKQLNERILATMPDGVIVTDDLDRILLVNKAFRKMFQLNQRSNQNKSLREIIHKDQLHKIYNAVKQGERDSATIEFRQKFEETEKVITCNIINMNDGQTLLTFTDISREREEEEKLYLTDRLASIGEMAAGLAHELNNPLTGVLALSQLLIDSDICEEYKEDLRCVFDEARRAADIVKNVLLFARNNNYENGQASVNEVINSVLRLREYEEKISNITVCRELDENLPEVAIDKFQLQQVFLNLILNAEAAIRDTKEPGTLTVKTERINNHIDIHFIDTGCGIKKNVLPRIFDPFFTTKDIGKGTGLGLSICYGIIVKNAGRISVKSRVNEGSTFTVTMPIAEV